MGIGFLISALLMLAMPSKISKSEVEKEARSMGMVYQSEVKALYK